MALPQVLLDNADPPFDHTELAKIVHVINHWNEHAVLTRNALLATTAAIDVAEAYWVDCLKRYMLSPIDHTAMPAARREFDQSAQFKTAVEAAEVSAALQQQSAMIAAQISADFSASPYASWVVLRPLLGTMNVLLPEGFTEEDHAAVSVLLEQLCTSPKEETSAESAPVPVGTVPGEPTPE